MDTGSTQSINQSIASALNQSLGHADLSKQNNHIVETKVDTNTNSNTDSNNLNIEDIVICRVTEQEIRVVFSEMRRKNLKRSSRKLNKYHPNITHFIRRYNLLLKKKRNRIIKQVYKN